MKKLIIIGAGGLGREVLGYALDIPKEKRDWEVHGFIDDNSNALDNYNLEYKIVGSIKDYNSKSDEVFICALGEPKLKIKICLELKAKGASFINLIHPTASIGRTSTYGEGLVMAPNSVVTENVRLGKFVTINVFSVIGHDAVAEDGCTLSPHCAVTGFTYLEEGVFLGSHASVIPNIRVGKYSRIGAGSVVLKRVPPDVVMFGNPAKTIF